LYRAIPALSKIKSATVSHRTVFLNPADLDYVSLPTHKIEADRTDSYDDGLLDAPVQAKRAQIRRVK
jgi:hypothetical protein